MSIEKVPSRYVPENLNYKDKIKQKNMLVKSRKLYKRKKYFSRTPVKSYKSKTSSHITNAKKIYNINTIKPSKKLSIKTGCSISALKKIIKKGKGAYYSSGSRPNQTAHSWGIARLASAITGGKASAIDYKIIEEGCKHNKKTFKLAKKAKKKYKNGMRKTRKTVIKM